MSPVTLAFAPGITRCVLFNTSETTSHLLPHWRPHFLLPSVGPGGPSLLLEVSSIKMKSRIQGQGFLFSVFHFGGNIIKLLDLTLREILNIDKHLK